MKKNLDSTTILNELKGNSLFFQEKHSPRDKSEPSPKSSTIPLTDLQASDVGNDQVAKPVNPFPQSNKIIENKLDSNKASTLASYHTELINSIRKVVKSVGKEVSFVRLTPEEKNQLVDIVYTYRRQGIKTSENEINRIAVNFLLEDFKANGKESVLSKVIEALLA